MGRIVFVKMTVLPKLLYYFRTLPILVPLAAIRQVQTKMFSYIWASKGSRLAQATMDAPKHRREHGGPRLSKILCSIATN